MHLTGALHTKLKHCNADDCKHRWQKADSGRHDLIKLSNGRENELYLLLDAGSSECDTWSFMWSALSLRSCQDYSANCIQTHCRDTSALMTFCTARWRHLVCWNSGQSIVRFPFYMSHFIFNQLSQFWVHSQEAKDSVKGQNNVCRRQREEENQFIDLCPILVAVILQMFYSVRH